MKNLNCTERYIMGIWFEITALALLLSISINLQRMYLLMKNKNKNSGSWKSLMTKTLTLIFLFAWALMIVGYLLVYWKFHQLCFSSIYYLDEKKGELLQTLKFSQFKRKKYEINSYLLNQLKRHKIKKG